MDFTPDAAQETVVRLAGEVLDGTGTDPPERVWKALGQAGLLALSLPARLGGAGLGALETCLLLTEVGRRAAALPALSTLALGVLPVVRSGDRAMQDALLPGVAAGDVLLTAAIREPADPMPAVPGTVAAPAVTGTKVGVPHAEQAHRILVPVATAGGTAVAIVDPTAPGVTLRRTPSSTGEPEYTLKLDGVAAEVFGGAGAVADVYRCALAGACATGAGAIAGALALTTAHVRTREQFGRPLARFQAVAQQIADVYVVSRTLHLTALSAGWRLGADRPADGDLAVAAYWLAAEAPAAVRTCHHLHGGLGLDASYPLHRYSALVRDLVRLLGGAEYRLGRLPC